MKIPQPLLRVGILHWQAGSAISLELGLCLLEGHAWFETANDIDVMPAASVIGGLLRGESHRRPDIDFAREREQTVPPRRPDTVRRSTGPSDRSRPAPRRTAAAKIRSSGRPRGFFHRILFRQKHSAEERLHSHHVKVMGRPFYAGEPLRFAFPGEV